MSSPPVPNLDHFYTFGDIYETLDTCDELEMQLSRLKRQQLLTDEGWRQSKDNIAEIRERLQRFLSDAG